jgi:hypothetical protein
VGFPPWGGVQVPTRLIGAHHWSLNVIVLEFEKSARSLFSPEVGKNGYVASLWESGDQSWQKNIIHVYMNYQFTFPPEPRPTMRGETGVTKNNSAKENHRR